ncbi:hypothetical protein ACOKFD_09850 [Flagellimonas sp. S174]|uniref:hypothetical protein n=1 Tax=Flagellimonas sp. S174 TaxID=3410790 RepID=UPI003BF48691
MKNKTRKNQQFEFFSLADRTSVGHKLRSGTSQSPEEYRATRLKQKRWFSIHFIQKSS